MNVAGDKGWPVCILCLKTLAADSTRPDKLKRHLATLHPIHFNKPLMFFQRKLGEHRQQEHSFVKILKMNVHNKKKTMLILTKSTQTWHRQKVVCQSLKVFAQPKWLKQVKGMFIYLRCFNKVQKSLFCHHFVRVGGHEKFSSSKGGESMYNTSSVNFTSFTKIPKQIRWSFPNRWGISQHLV